ncbi:hypothetical protein CH238_00180 [[Clostridium] leptum DSM 753]|uniref:Uncharacterized protein n=1 Tax=[Clostridium] leptum DSM 753 TaxID=428125 RepID=A0A855A8F8_9FIRM|nr:hypothetical protein CH238_00180 [[Clostridium] leptum DSM 753]RGU03708.1 hypothetical protein DWW99_07250 [[Clostridium] leptum]
MKNRNKAFSINRENNRVENLWNLKNSCFCPRPDCRKEKDGRFLRLGVFPAESQNVSISEKAEACKR